MSYLLPKKTRALTLRRVKNWVLSILGLSIIFLAISFTLIRIAIKYVPDYRESIQEIISEQLDIQFEVEVIDAEIYWLVPRLNLINVDIYDRQREKLLIHVGEIDLSMDWLSTIKTGMPAINEVTLDGLNLQIGINKKSQLIVQDFVVNENIDDALQSANQTTEMMSLPIGDELKYLINNLNFKVLNSNVRLFNEKNEKYNKLLKNFNLRLLNSGDEHVFEVKTDLPDEYGKSTHLIIELQGDLFEYQKLTGKLYAAVKNIQIAPWLNDYWKGPALAINADVNAELWIDWENASVIQAQSNFQFNDVSIHYLSTDIKTRELQRLTGRVKWQREDDGWQMDIRGLESVRKGNPGSGKSAATIRYADKFNSLKLEADYLRIESLTYLSGMLFSADETQVKWIELLEKYAPTGDLYNSDIELSLNEPEKIKINTRFDNIGFSLPESEPAAVKNLRGSIIYYGNETWLALDSDKAMLEFNELFRNKMELSRLGGVLKLSYIDNALEIKSSSLEIATKHIETESRLHMSVAESDLFIDLITYYTKGDLASVSNYLPVSVMGSGLVKWLDKAIPAGSITDGGYLFYGNVKNFPFRGHEGISLVNAASEQVNLKYLNGWPEIRDMSADLRFENESMEINIFDGYILDSRISSGRASIASFMSPVLDIKGEINTELKDIRRYIQTSGLRNKVPEYLSNIKLTGNGKLDLELFIPLDGGSTEWGGTLITDNGSLLLEKENYQFDDLKGSVRFADAYFEIPDLQMRLGDDPVSLRLATRKQAGLTIYHFTADGYIEASSLLAPLPAYKNHMQGKANWDFDMELYSASKTPDLLMNINVESDLHGVSSVFPGALAKNSDEWLPMKLAMQLYSNSNMKYDLNLVSDRNISLHEFSHNWLLTADTPSIKGVVNISKDKAKGYPLKVNLDHFNINDFIQHKAKDMKAVDSVIEPGAIPPVTLQARNIVWNNFIFNHAELKTHNTKSGMLIDGFRLVAEDYKVKGQGQWLSSWNRKQSTSLEADLEIADLGLALKQIKLSEGFEQADGHAKLKWRWPDAPHKFNWKMLQGNAEISLNEGTITEVDAGAGRMLGIFSLQTLLSLDFADQLSSGFTFDSARGTFSFARGNAYTEDFEIESKVANLYFNGYVDIDKRQVNQSMRVRPHLSSTMTLGSAVVAGPTVGGLVYLFQKIFNPDSLSEYEYTVKGAISDPEVTLVSAPTDDQVQEDVFGDDE